MNDTVMAIRIPTYHEYRSCYRKIRHPTPAKARKAVRRHRRGPAMCFYECKYCGGYHLAKRRKKRKVAN